MAIETNLQHLATREDVEKMKSGMLRWFIGVLATVVVGTAVIIIGLTRIVA